MVEVFKTNVIDRGHAAVIVNNIHTTFNTYTANFDLEDCDRILRVESATASIDVPELTRMLNALGCKVEVLSDDQPANRILQL